MAGDEAQTDLDLLYRMLAYPGPYGTHVVGAPKIYAEAVSRGLEGWRSTRTRRGTWTSTWNVASPDRAEGVVTLTKLWVDYKRG